MENKLKLEQIVYYLPYKANIIMSIKNSPDVKAQKKELTGRLIDFILDDKYESRLILRSLSDLTKEIEVNGEKFVPVDRIFEGWKTDKSMKLWWYETELKLSCDNYDLVDFGIIQKLFEYHFDVFELIEKELAIDINIL